MSDWIARFRSYLGRPVDAASLGAFRILFGLCMAVEVIRYFDHGWIHGYFIRPVLTFPFPGFEFLKPWPGIGMYVHFIAMGGAALAVMLGWLYRPAIVAFFFLFAFVFLVEEANYLNHFYLITLLSFLLIWMPADRWGALRFGKAAARGPRGDEPATVPQWTIFLLRTQLFIVYVFGGIAKLNPDWLRGQPMSQWLAAEGDMPILGPYVDQPWLGLAFSYGGLVYDLSIGFLLLWRPTRVFALLWSAMFHFLNMNLFRIGIFPWLAMGATLIFLEPDWPRRLIAWLQGRFRALPAAAKARNAAPPTDRRLLGWGATAAIVAYLSVQFLLPLRHWLYPGDVSWTEEGHVLSWHMKLRDKSARLRSFIVVHPVTGKRYSHRPREILTRRQYRKMVNRPRLIRYYANWLADRCESEWGARPQIYVDLWSSLNGRAFQPLIDSSVDLAAQKYSLASSPWIVPLRMPLPAAGAQLEASFEAE
jgi:hypothetical protein